MLKKRNRLLAFLIFLLVSSPLFMYQGAAWAQSINIEGQVRDADTDQALVGVNIVIQGTTQGTTTDLDGNFSLTADAEAVLVFRYIGYQSLEVPVEGRTSLDVRLRSESIYGDEIVFIGYGVRRVEDNTGSISTVSSADFNQGGLTNVGEMFQGRVPGVEVTTSDGAPGAGTVIRVRGGSSLSASNDPLFVVDGMVLEGGGISGMRNPLNTINPNDIESITVLKDASATAIYGSRASNGVIIITTKRGRVDQPLSVNYSGKFTLHTRRSTVGVLSTDEFRQTVDDLFGDRGTQYFGTADTDWQDEIYRNTYSQDHNISASGAYMNVPFHASFGFTGNNGI
ncbi:TonB-dependent receptor plug domain-containing protein, partial [Balneolaceae bacterium ANBcel3]|nr:TonB-dependent receptor plug domain-containing protein [Balneolaceae bacterium ANBcel3]